MEFRQFLGGLHREEFPAPVGQFGQFSTLEEANLAAFTVRFDGLPELLLFRLPLSAQPITGKPVQSAAIAHFKGRFREEFSNSHCAESAPARLEDARRTIEAWRSAYNRERPHSLLGYDTPEVVPDQLIRDLDGNIATGFS